MWFRRIINILFISFLCANNYGQRSDSFIPYRLPFSIDSVLQDKLSFIPDSFIDGMVLEIQFHETNRFVNFDQTITLIYLNNIINDTIHYLHYLAQKSNRFYLSDNELYRIPVIFPWIDSKYCYDRKKFNLSLADDPHKILLMMSIYGDKIVSVTAESEMEY